MRRHAFLTLVGVTLGLSGLLPGRVLAAGSFEAAPSPGRFGPPESMIASSGVFDPFFNSKSYEIGAEVRYAPRRVSFLPRFVPELAPAAGVIAGVQGSVYVYAGVQLDLPLGGPWRGRWTLTPGWATGLYHRSPEFDLGGPLEFRTSLDLSYRLAGGARLGVCLYHLSNAGIFARNPGSESLVLTYRAGVRPGGR
jgi:hypothetical protein